MLKRASKYEYRTIREMEPEMQAKEINTEDGRAQKSRKENHDGKKRLRELYTNE
jgi:hypothetical protein